MKLSEFSAMTEVMAKVGKKITQWRADGVYRNLHLEADFKTEADMRAHELLYKEITRLYPGVPILSEESLDYRDERPTEYWLIDPIDGTASWYHGFSGFVTQAALFLDGKPTFGIIHAPVLKKTWQGLSKHGAYLNQVRLSSKRDSQRLVVIDNTPVPHGITKFLCAELEVTNYLESGSLGLKAALVADGTADLFVKNVVVRDWDFAPAAVILEEVGCFLSLPNGERYEFTGAFEKESGVVIACDKQILDQAVHLFDRFTNAKHGSMPG